MCRYRCEGRGCQAAQGFIWYAYAECPSCKCVAAGEKTDRSVSVEEEEVVEYDDDGNELPMYFEQEEEPELTVFEKAFEFIDDHGHEVLGGLFVLVLAAVCIPLIILGTLHGPVATAGAKEKDDKANEKATDKKKD